jgi:hypothetical protein
MSRRLDWLARAEWLGADRARAWERGFLALSVLGALAWCALSRNGLDHLGKPLGTDFLSFYAASKMVLAGHAAGVYSVPQHHAAEIAVFGRDLGYWAFFYPPLFLMICAPLASLPYLPALAVWLMATGAAYLATVRAWLLERFGLLTAVAFPAVLINLGNGQNAFLSTALIGSGAMWLDRRPILAGVALGLLAYKPHLGVLLPVVLLVAQRWTTTISAAATVLAFAGVSFLAFGTETWASFLANSQLARLVLETGGVEPYKMISTFAAARALGAPATAAYALQAAVTIYVVGRLVRARKTWVRDPAAPALLVMTTLLGTPFLLDYDLVILALPLAWLASTGVHEGFRPWEKIALAAGFALPLFIRSLARLDLPLAPLVLLTLFQLVLARAEGRVTASEAAAHPAASVAA